MQSYEFPVSDQAKSQAELLNLHKIKRLHQLRLAHLFLRLSDIDDKRSILWETRRSPTTGHSVDSWDRQSPLQEIKTTETLTAQSLH